MSTTALHDTLEKRACVFGILYEFPREPALPAVPIATSLTEQATANTYAQGSMEMWTTIARCAARTAACPAGQIDFTPAESTAEAIMEIRRRSGLTWEELGDLFNVSRRSVHHWANGKPVTADHDRTIRRMLAAVRHVDRGERAGTRATLLAVDRATGVSPLDLLKAGRFEEAMGRIEGIWMPEPPRISLSRAAQDARRPPAPALLLGAEQDRPDIQAKARAARARRTPRTTD